MIPQFYFANTSLSLQPHAWSIKLDQIKSNLPKSNSYSKYCTICFFLRLLFVFIAKCSFPNKTKALEKFLLLNYSNYGVFSIQFINFSFDKNGKFSKRSALFSKRASVKLYPFICFIHSLERKKEEKWSNLRPLQMDEN